MTNAFSLLLFNLITLNCFSQHNSDEKILTRDNLILYIEARSNDGTGAGEFGEVTLLDPVSKSKFYVTNDSYYDSSPIWSPDRKSILFLSNRQGSRLSLQIKGIGGPYEIYIFDLNSKELRSFGAKLMEREPRIFGNFFYRPCWAMDGKSILFQHFNKIYCVDIEAKSLQLVKELGNESFYVNSIDLSPNGYLLAVEYDTTHDQGNHPLWNRFGILDLRDLSFHHIADEVSSLCGWHPDGDRFLALIPPPKGWYKDASFYHYSFKRARLEKFDLKNGLYDPMYLPNGKLVGLLSPDTTKELNSEIFLYDPTIQHLEQLTSDGLKKESLRTYLYPVK